MSEGWDQSRFNETLTRYVEVSRRDMPVILNTKAFYIARGAVRETLRSDKNVIKSLGKLKTRDGGLLLAALINKRGGPSESGGSGGPYRPGRRSGRTKGSFGIAMKAAISKLIKSRVKSIAFLASGWLWSIKTLEPLADAPQRAPRKDSEVKSIGQTAKGRAEPATYANHIAKIINSAQARHDRKGALIKYGESALETAFASEAASMENYIAKKMSERAKEAQATL